MTPQYRYLPLLLVLGILWAPFKFNHRITTIILMLLCGNLTLSFLGRHTAALAQRESRNPVPVFDFLHEHIEGKTPLILKGCLFFFQCVKAYQQLLRPHLRALAANDFLEYFDQQPQISPYPKQGLPPWNRQFQSPP